MNTGRQKAENPSSSSRSQQPVDPKMPQPDWTIEDYEKAGVSLPQTLADEAMMDHLHEWMKTAPDHPLKPK